jgi:hypothetical protein
VSFFDSDSHLSQPLSEADPAVAGLLRQELERQVDAPTASAAGPVGKGTTAAVTPTRCGTSAGVTPS